MNPIFFETQFDFRKYLEENHKVLSEINVGFYKIGSGKPSMTWPESVDQALCFGWIDGITRSIDKDSYNVRFTPRRKSSIWSAVNIKKVENLIEQGLMKEEGLAIYKLRTEEKSKIYSFEKEEQKFSDEYEAIFKANHTAWDYFQSLAPTYRKPSSNWVISAKNEETKLKRLNELIADSAAGTNKWKHSKYKK